MKKKRKLLLSDQIFRYRNGLYLNQDVVSEEKWTVDYREVMNIPGDTEPIGIILGASGGY